MNHIFALRHVSFAMAIVTECGIAAAWGGRASRDDLNRFIEFITPSRVMAFRGGERHMFVSTRSLVAMRLRGRWSGAKERNIA